MNSRNHRYQQDSSVSVIKYIAWFFAAFIVTAFLGGLVQLILPKWKLIQLVMGVAMVYGSAEFARRRFLADQGRGFTRSEKWRMFWGAELVLFIVVLAAFMIILKAYNASPWTFRKMPESFGFLVAFGSCIFYALVFWFSFWYMNAREPQEEVFVQPVKPKVRVLVIGAGGREHALAWKLAQSKRVIEVLVAPGNAGTAREAKCRNIDIATHEIDKLIELVKKESVGLTVVGPEAPLVAGIVNRFRAENLRVFGPTQTAAQLEGSKAFAKDFLARHKIPTANYAVFNDVELALDHLHEVGAPIVIKADGLAAGKGVVVAMTFDEAEAAIVDMLSGNKLGAAGSRVVIEEFLEGEEASFICMVDGKTALPMATSQDHKRVHDGDTGPNTGGMGAYSPAPVVTPEIHARVMREVIEPTVKGMIADGIPFIGFLYAGLMIDASGASKVIEFNVRFGDPETQPIMMRLQSDLLELIESALDGQLHETQARWNPRPALGVVMAARNYPEAPQIGDVIEGLNTPSPMGSKIFHASTTPHENQVLTSGGRVLCACALGDSVADAQRLAYAAVAGISWDGEFHRSDIGWRAIEREKKA